MTEDKGCPPSCNYFKVKNDWWEAIIRHGLPMRERQCLDWIIRMTYGWQKKEAEISMADFVSATNIAAPNVSRCLKLLKYKRIINVDKKPGNRQVTYSFNKYFNQWRNPEVITDDNFAEVITDDNLKLSPVIKPVITSDNFKKVVPIIVKDTRKTIKDMSQIKKKIFDKSSIPYQLSLVLFDQILINLPDFKPSLNGKKEETLQGWSDHIDKMIRLDKRDPAKIKQMIVWCQNDDFWFSNIQSGSKLRKQYDKLSAEMIRESRKTNQKGSIRNETREERIKNLKSASIY